MSNVNTDALKFTLVHAVTRYDRRQEAQAKRSKRGYYNHYALPQYLGRVYDVVDLVSDGMTPRDALCQSFNDRLLDYLLKSINEPVAS